MKTFKSLKSSPIARVMARAALLIGCAVLVAIFAPGVRAEDPSPRKVIARVAPKYPEYLKTHEIGGVVRLSVVVNAAGTVKSVTPVGGNPILIDAAVDAVKQWKYAPGDNTDSFEVKLEFIPRQQ